MWAIAPRTAVMLAAAGLVASAVAGCDDREPSLGAPMPVTIYARVSPPTQVWVGIQPLANPPFEVGFNGRDVGVACTTAAAGSQVAVLSGSPAAGPVNVVAHERRRGSRVVATRRRRLLNRPALGLLHEPIGSADRQ
jgi:hypothetical protein